MVPVTFVVLLPQNTWMTTSVLLPLTVTGKEGVKEALIPFVLDTNWIPQDKGVEV